jgi:hypothetical protein
MKVKSFILLMLLFYPCISLTAQTKRSGKAAEFSLSTPRKTFMNFLAARKTGGAGNLNRFFSKTVKEIFGDLNAESSNLKALVEIENYEKVTILNTFINENRAALVIHDGVNNMPSIVYLVREDDGWKIALNAYEGDVLNNQQALELKTQSTPISPKKNRTKKHNGKTAPVISPVAKPH